MRIYNTLTGAKDLLTPMEPSKFRMYVCGVTVYDYCHIGHARSALVFDVLRRYLESQGHTVEFVKNFTDVDDKIIKRARDEGVPCEAVTKKYIEAYYDDMEKLGVHRASVEPKATEHIPDIIELVKALIDKKAAYQVNGDVYFSVEAYPAYGRLSKRRLEDLLMGARIEIDERKQHPMDFALWKSSKPGEPYWESPWGPGRPGWHIECSAMAKHYLGTTFDIHGGGMDLIFPHHENEMAQSCAATGQEFARTWVHNGFVQFNQEKMSKSVGNFFTIREVFEKCGQRYGWNPKVAGEVLRYFLLATHYRSPLEFSESGLVESKKALDNIYDLFLRLGEQTADSGTGDPIAEDAMSQFTLKFHQAMDDDLNTPAAIAEFQRLRAELNKSLESGLSKTVSIKAREAYRDVGRILGLFDMPARGWQFVAPQTADNLSIDMREAAYVTKMLTDTDIELCLKDRNEARRNKDFKRADDIRHSLLQQGITIEDRPDGTSRWKR